MGKTLNEIAQELLNSNKNFQLIYGFNGVGKTRLSREFKKIVEETPEEKSSTAKALYYNAFTEDLFYWDNNSRYGSPRLMIHPNAFTQWIFEEQGQDSNVIKNFQYYTSDKLYPRFNAQYTHSQYSIQNKTLMDTIVPAFSEVRFAYECGNKETPSNIKISKGEESCFIWSVFFSLLEQVIEVLNEPDKANRETVDFNQLQYIFIDDPVTSLDENHLIQIAVDLAELINKRASTVNQLKFVITTHNALFFNVLSNELKSKGNLFFTKNDDGSFDLSNKWGESNQSFSYHHFLIDTIHEAIKNNKIEKYHFILLRNLYEKTANFLGYKHWTDLLPSDRKLYEKRIMNFYSHRTLTAEEAREPNIQEKNVVSFLFNHLIENSKFSSREEN